MKRILICCLLILSVGGALQAQEKKSEKVK